MSDLSVDRLLALIGRFDAEDKEGLARRLVGLLELSRGESLAGKAALALGRDLTTEEAFRLRILDLIVKDRSYFEGDDQPDDFGAPKSGL